MRHLLIEKRKGKVKPLISLLKSNDVPSVRLKGKVSDVNII